MSEVGSNPAVIVHFTEVNVTVSFPLEGDYPGMRQWENGIELSTHFTPTEPKKRGFNVRGKLIQSKMIVLLYTIVITAFLKKCRINKYNSSLRTRLIFRVR